MIVIIRPAYTPRGFAVRYSVEIRRSLKGRLVKYVPTGEDDDWLQVAAKLVTNKTYTVSEALEWCGLLKCNYVILNEKGEIVVG